ncbi:uncharacterized protein N7473_011852 [Penicillium subrubescens]|uniref:uncharacterized protein n=1 Tax=Penicillium subrubescens TaxID=1316194 RepID=UPI0025454637|nr:uncharacterized protein N7473_011852 [Penicillium subrubescens]KAJ5880799.1 hypothetical protein N7473_011852 [Penicillium subrubescens]
MAVNASGYEPSPTCYQNQPSRSRAERKAAVEDFMGLATAIPALSTSSSLTPAGPWATSVKRYRSDVAEINLHSNTPLLRELYKRRSQWELMIRVKYAMDWNPVSL